jgi:hypothetical protein
MTKKEVAVRWYERQHWRYGADRQTADEYARWLKPVKWQLFCTFTFAWPVSDPQAQDAFDNFINRLESAVKSDVGVVCGSEKRFSGCGKPACGRHFHALLTSVAPLQPSLVTWLWTSMAGRRADNAGADVQPYDAGRNGASYVLKLVAQPYGDWTFRKLHLFHPSLTKAHMTSRMRRNLRRHRDRQQEFVSART